MRHHSLHGVRVGGHQKGHRGPPRSVTMRDRNRLFAILYILILTITIVTAITVRDRYQGGRDDQGRHVHSAGGRVPGLLCQRSYGSGQWTGG